MAQTVGNAFIFSDTSIQKSDLDILQTSNESTVYVMTINSTDGKIIYDPTSDYTVVFHPTILNTYGTSAGGIINFIVNNPEVAAIILLCIIIAVLIGIGIAIILFGLLLRRR